MYIGDFILLVTLLLLGLAATTSLAPGSLCYTLTGTRVTLLHPHWSCCGSLGAKRGQVLEPRGMLVLGPVQGGPHRHAHKQAHGLGVVRRVKREAVVDALGQHQQVSLLAVHPDPRVRVVTHVKVACGGGWRRGGGQTWPEQSCM